MKKVIQTVLVSILAVSMSACVTPTRESESVSVSSQRSLHSHPGLQAHSHQPITPHRHTTGSKVVQRQANNAGRHTESAVERNVDRKIDRAVDRVFGW